MNAPPRPLDPVTDPANVALGAAIRKVMEEREVSVNALHLATGLSRQTITRSLDGTRTLDFRQFDKIATALGGIHKDIITRYTELAA
jgi:hypothetical protein